MQKYNNCNNLSAFFIYLYLVITHHPALMNTRISNFLTKCILIILFFGSCSLAFAQNNSDFWDRVRFGGGIGAAFGNGYTDVTIAPGALYEVNQYVGIGVGIQGTYVSFNDYYESFIYGGSLFTLVNPIPQLQLSAELEQLRVNLSVDDVTYGYDRDFWNTALFLGAGYRMENVTIGLRYNILYRERDLVYSDALMPFIRVFF